jgi:large subunit ribosomal protein L9
MNVILLEGNRHLGKIGDTVSVKPGYARNFLIPQKKAIMATVSNIAKFEERRAELERAAHEVIAAAQKIADTINDKTITITAKAGDEGRLFGSIGTSDIVKTILDQLGATVKRAEIALPHGTIRHAGEYAVDVHLHSDVVAKINLHVVAEK